jgi:hypothetical protein
MIERQLRNRSQQGESSMKLLRPSPFVFALTLLICLIVPFSCGDDDDDDDDNEQVGDWSTSDCQTACSNMIDCGGDSYFTDADDCADWCEDWLDEEYECADCMLSCWTGGSDCSEDGQCMEECAVGPCADEFDSF